MTTLLVIIIFIIPIIFAIISPYAFIIFTFIINGIPLSWITESRGTLELFKGMSGAAIELSGFMVGTVLIIGINLKKCVPYLSKYSVHIFFLIFGFLSLIWASDLIFGLRMLAKLLAPLLLIIALSACITSVKDAENLETAIFISAIIYMLFAVSNYVFKYAPVFTSNEIPYLTVPGSSPAVFSFKMACVSLLALTNYLIRRRIIYLILFILFTVAVFMAFTRISMLGIIISSALCIFMLTKSMILRTIIPILIVLIFAASFFLSDTLKARMFKNPERVVSVTQALGDPQNALKNIHTSGRSLAWEISLKKFYNRNPIYGSGIGATQAWFYEGGDKKIGVLHSEYLRLLCELGLIGLILFALTLMSYSIISLKGYVKNNIDYIKKYSTLSISCIVFYAITLATDNSFDYVLALEAYVFCFIYLSLFTQNDNII